VTAINALYSCVRQESPKGVEWCLSKGGADPNARTRLESSTARTMLSIAAENNDKAETIKALLDGGADPNIPDQDGSYPLHKACEQYKYGESHVVEALVKGGADVNARDSDGCTPLHVAANHGNAKNCRLLVGNGADSKARNKNGTVPGAISNEVDVQIACDPEIIANPVCRSCHLAGKALAACQKLDKVKRNFVLRVPEECAFKLELVVQKDLAKQEVAGKLRGGRLENLRSIQKVIAEEIARLEAERRGLEAKA
jgi:hypothetical protein